MAQPVPEDRVFHELRFLTTLIIPREALPKNPALTMTGNSALAMWGGKKKSKTASPLGFEVLLPVGQEKGQIGTSLPTPGTYWKGHVPEDKDKVFLCHVVE